MEICIEDKPVAKYRNPRATDREKYQEDLNINLSNVKTKISNKTDMKITCKEAITNSYQDGSSVKNHQGSWWNYKLTILRNRTRKLFNGANNTAQWEE